jgi:hypothetical protein
MTYIVDRVTMKGLKLNFPTKMPLNKLIAKIAAQHIIIASAIERDIKIEAIAVTKEIDAPTERSMAPTNITSPCPSATLYSGVRRIIRLVRFSGFLNCGIKQREIKNVKRTLIAKPTCAKSNLRRGVLALSMSYS